MKIIPAIDIIDGKCVRLTQGDYNAKTMYSANPVDVALGFEAAGVQHLHLVDLDGARSSHIVNQQVLAGIAAKTKLKIDFGGGIKTDSDVEIALNAGASQVTAGSVAVTSKNTVLGWIKKYGPARIILGADVKNRQVAINGWQHNTDTDIYEHIAFYAAHGIEYVICTDVAKDGMLQGPSFQLYRDILERFPQIKLIASGGISSLQDVKQLAQAGLYGAIIGKAIYEGKIDVGELMALIR
jgi:phosphoribosylformimino-5-aminoimidazole carboxamide ribotide isomerase